MKLTTLKIHHSPCLSVEHTDKKTGIAVVKDPNEIYGNNVSVRTVSMILIEEFIGVSPTGG